MKPFLLVVLPSLLLGCSSQNVAKEGDVEDSGSGDGNDGSDGSDDGADGGDGDDGGGDGDPWGELDRSGCEEADGVPHPGAASYWYGDYEGNPEDGWIGTETWIFLANEAWKELGHEDCEIVYKVTATQSSAGSCGACDIGVEGTGVFDRSLTTCSDEVSDLWEGEEAMELTYGVVLGGDGTATWFFAGSGDLMGTGKHDEEGMTFLTGKKCLWF